MASRAPSEARSQARGNALALGFALVASAFAYHYADREPYDDAHFFERIAQNLLRHGTLAWNVDEGPVYGVTSQTFQGLAVLLAAVAGDHFMLGMRALAVACLVAAFVAIHRLTRDEDRGASVVVGFCSATLLFPITSGMETALAVLLVSGQLWLLHSERGRGLPWQLGPIGVLLLYLTRPDAALLGLGLLVGERWSRDRRRLARELALTLALLAVFLLVLRAVYGTALPLPFYAKQAAFTPYDASFIELSNRVGRKRFFVFALTAVPLGLIALARLDRENRVLLGTALAFVAYHLLFTIDVMGMHGRFFAPALPLLIVACARTFSASAAEAPRGWLGVVAVIACLFALTRALPDERALEDSVPAFLLLTSIAGSVLLALSFRFAQVGRWLPDGVLLAVGIGALFSSGWRAQVMYSDQEFLALQSARRTVYRGLESLRACFGEKIHVYHSEVGLVGLRFQDGKVSDLAGLLSPRWLFREQTFDQACLAEAPEAIFLPHRNYAAQNREISASACLLRYRRVVSDSSSPLYVRADLHGRFLGCAGERRDPFVDGVGDRPAL